MTNELTEIAEALTEISGVRKVSRGWPKSFAAIPMIVISEMGNSILSTADDEEAETELSVFVRVFCVGVEACDGIASEVNNRMEALGYLRTSVYDDDSAEVRQKCLIFVKTIQKG